MEQGLSTSNQYGDVRVIVSGSFPDRMNNNLVLRGYLAEGLCACLGETAVLDIPFESLVSAVHLHKPALVLCFGSCPPGVSNFYPLRKACDDVGAHLAMWLHDDPYEFDWGYSAMDVADTLFSNDSWSALHYDHPRVFHLPLAASQSAHYRDWQETKDIDVFFCGVAFSNRVSLLRDITSTLKKYRTLILGDGWPKTLPGVANRRISNAELADHAAGSLATLYMGRNLQLANDRYQLDSSTPGPRFFEAAMTGTVQLVFADSLEVLEYFSQGEGILLYDNPSSFAHLLERLHDQLGFAKMVALAGQHKAIKNHSYEARARVLLTTCKI